MARRLSDLSAAARRWAITKAALRILTAWALLFGAYYVSPTDRLAVQHIVLVLVTVAVLYGTVVAWHAARVSRAELPQVRAVEAVGFIVPFFLVLFASIYLGMAYASPKNFSAPMNHTNALYLTVTMFATVGFGDITPVTALARIVASIQMMLDLVVLGVIVKVVFNLGQQEIDRPRAMADDGVAPVAPHLTPSGGSVDRENTGPS
jgi:voltage-gated potassium channel